jgi:hypothetical protein
MDPKGGKRAGEGAGRKREGGCGEDGEHEDGACGDNIPLQNLHEYHSENAKCITNNPLNNDIMYPGTVHVHMHTHPPFIHIQYTHIFIQREKRKKERERERERERESKSACSQVEVIQVVKVAV